LLIASDYAARRKIRDCFSLCVAGRGAIFALQLIDAHSDALALHHRRRIVATSNDGMMRVL